MPLRGKCGGAKRKHQTLKEYVGPGVSLKKQSASDFCLLCQSCFCLGRRIPVDSARHSWVRKWFKTSENSGSKGPKLYCPQSAWFEVFPSREAMLKKSIATILMGSIFPKKKQVTRPKVCNPEKLETFIFFFGWKGSFPTLKPYSFSLLTKKSPQSFQAEVLFLSSWSSGSGNWDFCSLKLRSWSWSLHERSLGKPFFFSRPKSSFWSKTKFGRFFSHETSNRISVGRYSFLPFSDKNDHGWEGRAQTKIPKCWVYGGFIKISANYLLKIPTHKLEFTMVYRYHRFRNSN